MIDKQMVEDAANDLMTEFAIQRALSGGEYPTEADIFASNLNEIVGMLKPEIYKMALLKAAIVLLYEISETDF